MNYDDETRLMKDRMAEVQQHWSRQFENVREDLEFFSGSQWSDAAKKERKNKPTLTLNFTKNYVDRIVNQIRKYPFGINVKNEDPKITHLYQGLIRDIEYRSNASEAFEQAFESAVAAGVGFIAIDTGYEDETTLNQTISINRIADTTSVYIDPCSEKIDGSDAEYAIRVRYVDKRKAENEYNLKDDTEHQAFYAALFTNWMVPENTLPELIYYTKESKKIKRTWLQDGTFFDGESDIEPPAEMIAGTRMIERKYVKVCKYIGGKKIDETILNCSYIPIIPVYGDKVYDGQWSGYSGIVRLVRDQQTMINNYASAEAQLIHSAPTSPWLIAEGQVAGYEKIWSTANSGDWDHLPYNPQSLNGQQVPPPTRVTNSVDTGHLVQARMGAIEDMQRSTGIFDSQMGKEDISQQSGKAIMLKNRNADIASYHYTDNFTKSITQCGRVILELINSLYDTNRKLNVRGENGEVVPIEGNIKEMNIDPNSFDSEVEAGPMVANERDATNAMLMEIGQMLPQKFEMIADLLIENLQTPGTEEAVARLRKMLPPELLPEDENSTAPDPEAIAALQQAEAAVAERDALIDQYEQIIKQLQTMIIDSERDRQNKVEVEEIKSQTELAKTELNNEAKVIIEQMKQTGRAESDMTKIAADAQKRISDLADKATMEVEQSIEMIPNVEDAESMIQKTAGPVVMDETVEQVDFPTEEEL